MRYQDKAIQCSDCSTTFTFSAEEQEQFASRGYTNEPKRCPSCRQARKTERYGNSGPSYGQRRQMFPAKCAQCGKSRCTAAIAIVKPEPADSAALTLRRWPYPLSLTPAAMPSVTGGRPG